MVFTTRKQTHRSKLERFNSLSTMVGHWNDRTVLSSIKFRITTLDEFTKFGLFQVTNIIYKQKIICTKVCRNRTWKQLLNFEIQLLGYIIHCKRNWRNMRSIVPYVVRCAWLIRSCYDFITVGVMMLWGSTWLMIVDTSYFSALIINPSNSCIVMNFPTPGDFYQFLETFLRHIRVTQYRLVLSCCRLQV